MVARSPDWNIIRPVALSVLEICAGGGGQAIGLEQAGFACEAAIELEQAACRTLRLNRPGWQVIESDVREIDGANFKGIDLFAGGVPCPPFSIAGKQLGTGDERDLFPEALRLIDEIQPAAVMLENVPGFASSRFSSYRRKIADRLSRMGYVPDSRILNASGYGVPQLRPRFILVALKPALAKHFVWPEPETRARTVAAAIGDLMASRGWPGAAAWKKKAKGIAPTLVGGSKKHGGPDLGPTRARRQWAQLGVNGLSIAGEAPGRDDPEDLLPRLTLRMVARLQGFPDSWDFWGGKTAAYRQIGNAFPPPVAAAVGASIKRALHRRVGRAKRHGQIELFAAAG